jgi:hypothetical protein
VRAATPHFREVILNLHRPLRPLETPALRGYVPSSRRVFWGRILLALSKNDNRSPQFFRVGNPWLFVAEFVRDARVDRRNP